ncbi:MAG TPA: class I SAM-dependent methyltransferase [Acidimicrobiales bacterium]|nr:class I SAM-dependent methyltransferase [Acidimicrobiales bacterium]
MATTIPPEGAQSERGAGGGRDVDLSFLAPPGAVCDWRMVMVYDAAVGAGVLAGLPADAGELAARLGLNGHALEVVLGALAVWGVVEADAGGVYRLGHAAPPPDAAAVLRHHAGVLRQWSEQFPGRLLGDAAPPTPNAPRRPPPDPEVFLDGLVPAARRSAPAMVDACLARAPGAKRVLDLGGCHGEHSLEFAGRGLSVTLQDRPVITEIVRRRGRLAQAGVEVFTGDLFEVLPDQRFDIVFCSGVVDGFEDERIQQMYRRVEPLVAPGGMFVLCVFLDGGHAAAALFAVLLLAIGSTGHINDEADHRRWLAEAGLGSVERVDLFGGRHSLLVARRPLTSLA